MRHHGEQKRQKLRVHVEPREEAPHLELVNHDGWLTVQDSDEEIGDPEGDVDDCAGDEERAGPEGRASPHALDAVGAALSATLASSGTSATPTVIKIC